jgi:hypothetical protein
LEYKFYKTLKKILLLSHFILFSITVVFAQTNNQDDSTTTFNAYYVRMNPVGISSDMGKFSSKIIQNIEIGKSFGPLDLGLTYGRFAISDSTNFLQIRSTFDASQIGIFSSEFALGAGKVFKSTTPLMFEVSTTLMAQVSKNIGIGAIVGTYDFIGENNQFNKSFYGIFLRYGLLRTEGGFLQGRIGKRMGKRTTGKKTKVRKI